MEDIIMKKVFLKTAMLLILLSLVGGLLFLFKQSTIAKEVPPRFEVVSTMRVESARNVHGSISLTNDKENFLVVIIKHTSTAKLTIHSTDFALAFESDSDIPRRPCIGVSYGMKSSKDAIIWTSSLGGSVFRGWIEPSEPYFALIFGAPMNVHTFSLYHSVPIFKPFTETKDLIQ
jgi:hypothetical protein